jgi:hypothetical protein
MTNIKEITTLHPDLLTLVKNNKVTYRGCGFGKDGFKIKVAKKEYVISHEELLDLEKINKIQFSAPFRKN